MITSDKTNPLSYPFDHRIEHASLAQLPPGMRRDIEAVLSPSRLLNFNGAVLMGGVGAGKTFAMAAAMRSLLPAPGAIEIDDPKAKRPPFWCVWPFVLSDIEEYRQKRKQHTNDPTIDSFDPQRYLANYNGALFIDDVGSEYDKWGDAAAVFSELVMQRVLRPHPLWITTNLTIDDFESRYGERVVSRLAAHCLFITVPGGDRRVDG